MRHDLRNNLEDATLLLVVILSAALLVYCNARWPVYDCETDSECTAECQKTGAHDCE